MQSGEFDRESAREQLAKMLSSNSFVHSPQLCRFLRYLVEQAIGGKGDQIKEYLVGVEVFQRDQSFDPRIDPVVRTEARRLRQKLAEYYQNEGQADPIKIEIPKGSYCPAIRRRMENSTPPPAFSRAEAFPRDVASARTVLNRKQILAAIALVAVGGIAAYWLAARDKESTRPPTRLPSIAVLPLENLSADAEQEYFSDGMTDALITDLAKIRALRVVSRTSAIRYKKVKMPLAEIARELGVDYVVEGTVLRARNRVRLTVQLISVRMEGHVWAESYERDFQDILALQAEMARVIAREVRVQLTPQDQARLSASRTVNRDAYEAYLKGRYYQAQRTEDGLKKSVGYFQEAIAKDRGYGRAYSGLADSYTYLVNHGFVTPREVAPQAKATAVKAIEIDDTIAEAHTSLAYIRMVYDWDWPGAEREFQRSIELDPGYPRAHSLFACYFALHRHFDEAIAEIRLALELDPLSIYDNTNLGWHLHMARRYDAAIEQLRKTVDMDPGSYEAHHGWGRVLEQKGMYDEAIAKFQKAIALSAGSPTSLSSLAHAYARAGRRGEAHKTIDQLRALSKHRYVSSYDMAVVYIALGNKIDAFAWLDKAEHERDGWLWLYLNVDPRLDALRADSRFVTILTKMNLLH